ncbi:MAG TPA: PAC2 family protein [Ktedonobacterales bacterium]|nr:PAC2 family protein [Ktedonobacterales bacterium]
MEHAHVSRPQRLTRPILIGAFAGWNDAAGAATWAIKFLINQWDAEPFAEIDPDAFYDFTEARPAARISGGAVRRLSWPSNRFYAHHGAPDAEGEARDVVLFLGEEPHLRWKTFAREMAQLCLQLGVEEIVLLGVFSAEAPHTAPAPVTGATSRTATLRKMDLFGVERATYSGPTGIVTAVQDIARREGVATTSLWAAAPHYVSASPNLPVAEALLRRVDQIYDLDLSLRDLGRAARRFTSRVSSLVAADPEVMAYVRTLEQRLNGGAELDSTKDETLENGERETGSRFSPDLSGVHNIPSGGELPSPEEAIFDIETFLRRSRKQNGTDDAE